MLDGGQNNAMAETALALAMGFFSIMVLTMVSMSSGNVVGFSPKIPVSNQVTIKSSESSVRSLKTKPVNKKRLIVFFEGAFYDANMQKLEIRNYNTDSPIVLAVKASLPLAQAIKIQKQISAEKITITTLDNRWLKAFEEVKK